MITACQRVGLRAGPKNDLFFRFFFIFFQIYFQIFRFLDLLILKTVNFVLKKIYIRIHIPHSLFSIFFFFKNHSTSAFLPKVSETNLFFFMALHGMQGCMASDEAPVIGLDSSDGRAHGLETQRSLVRIPLQSTLFGFDITLYGINLLSIIPLFRMFLL